MVSKEMLGFIMRSENLGTRWAKKDSETFVKQSSAAVAAQGDHKGKAFGNITRKLHGAC